MTVHFFLNRSIKQPHADFKVRNKNTNIIIHNFLTGSPAYISHHKNMHDFDFLSFKVIIFLKIKGSPTPIKNRV